MGPPMGRQFLCVGLLAAVLLPIPAALQAAALSFHAYTAMLLWPALLVGAPGSPESGESSESPDEWGLEDSGAAASGAAASGATASCNDPPAKPAAATGGGPRAEQMEIPRRALLGLPQGLPAQPFAPPAFGGPRMAPLPHNNPVLVIPTPMPPLPAFSAYPNLIQATVNSTGRQLSFVHARPSPWPLAQAHRPIPQFLSLTQPARQPYSAPKGCGPFNSGNIVSSDCWLILDALRLNPQMTPDDLQKWTACRRRPAMTEGEFWDRIVRLKLARRIVNIDNDDDDDSVGAGGGGGSGGGGGGGGGGGPTRD